MPDNARRWPGNLVVNDPGHPSFWSDCTIVLQHAPQQGWGDRLVEQAVAARLGLLQSIRVSVAGYEDAGDRPVAVTGSNMTDRLNAGASEPQSIVGDDQVGTVRPL